MRVVPRRPVIGVMGAGEGASDHDIELIEGNRLLDP